MNMTGTQQQNTPNVNTKFTDVYLHDLMKTLTLSKTQTGIYKEAMTKLKIIHHNIRGINNKITELTLFINKHKPDIITLNETSTINNTYIPNYKISSPSPNPGRGVAILYKHDLTKEQLPTITTTEPTTNLHHAILIHTPTESIQIATIYCPRKKPISRNHQHHMHTP